MDSTEMKMKGEGGRCFSVVKVQKEYVKKKICR